MRFSMSLADSTGIEAAAADLIHVGKIMYDRGLTASNDGNISAKVGVDMIMITATSV
jgi:ribulose-5-phosphate 4-epimerase/fuculose-1-phosphate aldolase